MKTRTDVHPGNVTTPFRVRAILDYDKKVNNAIKRLMIESATI